MMFKPWGNGLRRETRTAEKPRTGRRRNARAARRHSGRRPIVVGVSDATESFVVEWAAIRASAGGTSLRVVHAYRWPVAYDPYAVVFWTDPAPLAAALARVDQAADYARALVPGLEVSTHIEPMSPASLLLKERRRAELIVVGRSRPSRFWPWVLTVNDVIVRRAKGRAVIVEAENEIFI